MLQFMGFQLFLAAAAFMPATVLVVGVYLHALDIVNIQEEVEVLYSSAVAPTAKQATLEEWEWFVFHTYNLINNKK